MKVETFIKREALYHAGQLGSFEYPKLKILDNEDRVMTTLSYTDAVALRDELNKWHDKTFLHLKNP